jgi:DNA transformation protein
MGIKGDKMTQDSVLSAEFIIEKLSAISGVSSKKMFGGHGIFSEGKMFGLIDSKGEIFLKVNDELKSNRAKLGSNQHSKMPYVSIPDSVLKDSSALIEWAKESLILV